MSAVPIRPELPVTRTLCIVVSLIAKFILSTLDDADFVVQPFEETERNVVFGLAIARDSIPVAFDHIGELIVRLKSPLLQARSPVLEKLARSDRAVVIAQLAEALLDQASGVEVRCLRICCMLQTERFRRAQDPTSKVLCE
jgi:hypothetical protein